MLRSVIISPDQEVADHLEEVLAATGEMSIVRKLDCYPDVTDMVRTLRACAPDVVFLNFESADRAQALVKLIESEAHGLQMVAFHRECDSAILRETMRAGVREFLSEPFEFDTVRESIEHLKAQLQRHPPTHEFASNIFSFLPSKAGVGTSTLALNVSSALARPGTRVLLADMDLSSGMQRFMLKLQNKYSVIDAVEHALDMDESLWPTLVTTIGSLDVLHAGRVNPNFRIENAQIRALTDFMRRNYQALCFDLSGNLERYSVEIMQESKRVFLVCTPEIPSLHQAREKLHFLREFDLESRVSIILNRCQKRALLSQKEVEQILGKPVLKLLPNDYDGVNRAMTEGACIDHRSEVGRAVESFAQELIERPAPTPADAKPRFLKFFSTPTRQLASGEK